MHTKFERLLSKSLTTLEVMTYYLVVHTGPGLFLRSTVSVVGKLRNQRAHKLDFCLARSGVLRLGREWGGVGVEHGYAIF